MRQDRRARVSVTLGLVLGMAAAFRATSALWFFLAIVALVVGAAVAFTAMSSPRRRRRKKP